MKSKWILLLIALLLLLCLVGCDGIRPEKYGLVAIKKIDNKTTSGSFFLFIGSITVDNETKYCAYIKNKLGIIKLIKVDPDFVTFCEDASPEKAFVLATPNAALQPYDEYCFVNSNEYNTEWEFHIPPGSITNRIDVNL